MGGSGMGAGKRQVSQENLILRESKSNDDLSPEAYDFAIADTANLASWLATARSHMLTN